MHSVWLGFSKQYIQYIILSNVFCEYSLKAEINSLNERLLSCRPPNYVAQPPRSLSTFKIWRAHEFMNFFLYFAIPVFKGIMKENYFDHLLHFVISMERLLSKRVKRSELPNIKRMLNLFIIELESLFDKDILSSGVHELSHLVDCTLDQYDMFKKNRPKY